METTTIITKEDERKALVKIRKIIESLGTNSYVATAFDGAFAIAEKNIEYDAAFSVRELEESYNKENDKTNEQRIRAERAEREAQEAKSREKNNVAYWQTKYNEEKAKADKAEYMKVETEKRAKEYAYEIDELREKQTEKESEIIRLKARLFDIIEKK